MCLGDNLELSGDSHRPLQGPEMGVRDPHNVKTMNLETSPSSVLDHPLFTQYCMLPDIRVSLGDLVFTEGLPGTNCNTDRKKPSHDIFKYEEAFEYA